MRSPAELVDAVLAGEHAAVARMLTFVERRADGVDEALAKLHQHAGGAHVLGLTGPPGSGKSTLVTALSRHYRAQGRTVGILAVDPSSVFSGGAILGDRIRMSELGGDPGVFIRSIATRGALGGLSRASLDALTVLDAAGKDLVILETVGVGQAEVDVISAAQTVAVVSVPGMGDDVQAIKAGLLEIADVHVVNKADREGAGRTVAELRDMLRLSRRRADQWNVPIEQTVAATGQGVAELAERFAEHLAWMTEHGERERRARRNAATRIRWVAEQLVLDRLRPGVPDFDRAVDEVTARRGDPLSAARHLVAHL
ncbi:methylmalonyl Co-A mutase-associated GTPase MeaB [Amycolatopsis acidiphila]|uniref:Methylmalonyl Co-A mutase-associated GTPase MeaB n=1 Tax=Amycolatopsis acidiphila TaxID=715473 RepID=A0A558AFD9_9PSEU|nr:methylmalonyl Co-A mutase-associated GTPase MeaB [Amycolatopsis acidiphila]TVT22988.1 methylmalonyl Co-A mutase-associated GTPase MeaB [Amycolatopsis acidiphila]UIJ57151.1 methylmalonyl Co-A mutase-associated GTPase MeaB [Amycolatopsis acidiphila]GHG53042.1 LAO/AO transport system kinase [Amycolatopsis acidiphila]